MSRRLAPDEAALWARVMASVKPLRAVPSAAPAPVALPARPIAAAPMRPLPARSMTRSTPAPVAPAARTLDAGWDRRLAKGMVAPDYSIDLHGHTLHSAHALLDRALADALAHGARLVLLVTGRPPRPESERPHARGAIRASVEDWIALSRHAGRVAAVRGAHPRHGGAGALYLVLRRSREIAPN